MRDLISRQAAIDALHMDTSIIPFKKAREYADATISEIRNRLEKLPSAEPKRGKWHYSDGKPARIGMSFGVICDQCGTESEYCTNFCGECGADMREETT